MSKICAVVTIKNHIYSLNTHSDTLLLLSVLLHTKTYIKGYGLYFFQQSQ